MACTEPCQRQNFELVELATVSSSLTTLRSGRNMRQEIFVDCETPHKKHEAMVIIFVVMFGAQYHLS